jgi:hypothetical protein
MVVTHRGKNQQWKIIYLQERYFLHTSDLLCGTRLRIQEVGNMSTAQKTCGIEPIPRYVRPDASVPEYDAILEQLQEYHRSPIGSSYYYIRVENGRKFLCRILPGGGKIYFHEIVDHGKYGIAEDELEESVRLDNGSFSAPGYYPVSPDIETKLRENLDYR